MPATGDFDPSKLMADAMAKVCAEEGIDLSYELLQLLAHTGLMALEPNQLMVSCGASVLEEVFEDEADRQEVAKLVFGEMVLASVQEPVEVTHDGNATEN